MGSKEITYKIARTSLADHIVNTESGKHYDNTVKIDIMSGGSSFFSRSFEKSDFEVSYLHSLRKMEFLKRLFLKEQDGKLVFSASVGIPVKLELSENLEIQKYADRFILDSLLAAKNYKEYILLSREMEPDNWEQGEKNGLLYFCDKSDNRKIFYFKVE